MKQQTLQTVNLDNVDVAWESQAEQLQSKPARLHALL
jgi:hypothetical protein